MTIIGLILEIVMIPGMILMVIGLTISMNLEEAVILAIFGVSLFLHSV
jgi:hypothetical protein